MPMEERTQSVCIQSKPASCIAPVSIPVLEEHTIQLIFHSSIRSTEYETRVIRRCVVNSECMNVTRFDRCFPMFGGQFLHHSIDLNHAYPALNSEVYYLKLGLGYYTYFSVEDETIAQDVVEETQWWADPQIYDWKCISGDMISLLAKQKLIAGTIEAYRFWISVCPAEL